MKYILSYLLVLYVLKKLWNLVFNINNIVINVKEQMDFIACKNILNNKIIILFFSLSFYHQ